MKVEDFDKVSKLLNKRDSIHEENSLDNCCMLLKQELSIKIGLYSFNFKTYPNLKNTLINFLQIEKENSYKRRNDICEEIEKI